MHFEEIDEFLTKDWRIWFQRLGAEALAGAIADLLWKSQRRTNYGRLYGTDLSCVGLLTCRLIALAANNPRPAFYDPLYEQSSVIYSLHFCSVPLQLKLSPTRWAVN